MFYVSTHRENNGGLLVFYYAKAGHQILTLSGFCPNESEWIVPGTINPEAA